MNSDQSIVDLTSSYGLVFIGFYELEFFLNDSKVLLIYKVLDVLLEIVELDKGWVFLELLYQLIQINL